MRRYRQRGEGMVYIAYTPQQCILFKLVDRYTTGEVAYDFGRVGVHVEGGE